MILFDTLRRSWRFHRKVRAAGYRIVGTALWPITKIHYPAPNGWARHWYKGWPRSVYFSPHYAALCNDGESYREWQRSLRGIDHPRPDEWITAMEQRLHVLYRSIRDEGYRCRCVADRIAVTEDGGLHDGGHRLACLAACGWAEVPVVIVQPCPSPTVPALRLARLALQYLLCGWSIRATVNRLRDVRAVPWPSWRSALLALAVKGHTMLPFRRLANLTTLALRVRANGVPGAFVECGVWKGGSGALLASLAGPGRGTWLLDSFQGCREPSSVDTSPRRSPLVAGEQAAPRRHAEHLLFEHLQLPRSAANIREGWIEDEAPTVAPIIAQRGGIALLHIDCNSYASVLASLTAFYPLVNPRGIVVLDDLGYWRGTLEAYQDVMESQGPLPVVTMVDHTAGWWQR